MNRGDDEVSVESDRSYRSRTAHKRERSRTIHRGNGSFDDGPDASQMVVQMMESKVKTLQNQLRIRKNKTLKN